MFVSNLVPVRFALAALAMGLCATSLRAVIPVTVDADVQGAITEAENVSRQAETMAKWKEQIEQARAAVQQAKQIYQQTQTIAKFISDPKAAIQNLGDLQEISGMLGEIAGEGTSFASAMNDVGTLAGSGQSLWDSADGLQDAIANFDSGGNPGNVSLYQALGATMRLSAITRDTIDKAIKMDDARIKAVDGAIAKGRQGGLTDITAASLFVQREAFAAQAAYVRQQQMLWKQEEERREREAKAAAAYQLELDKQRVEVLQAQAARTEANLAAVQRVTALQLVAPAENRPTNAGIRTWVESPAGSKPVNPETATATP